MPFFDPRRSRSRLTSFGKRVVLSLMHESIRVPNPTDCGEYRLAIVQFSDPDRRRRHPLLTYDSEVELFTYEALNEMIESTIAAYWAVCEDRDRDVHSETSEDVDDEHTPPLIKLWSRTA